MCLSCICIHLCCTETCSACNVDDLFVHQLQERDFHAVGKVNGYGNDGQQKHYLWLLWAMLNDSKHSYGSFSWIWPIGYVYKLVRCLYSASNLLFWFSVWISPFFSVLHDFQYLAKSSIYNVPYFFQNSALQIFGTLYQMIENSL